MSTVDRLVLRVLRSGWPWTVGLAVAALIDTATSVLLPAALGRAVDTVLGGGSERGVFVVLGILLGSGMASEFTYAVLCGRISADRTAALRGELLRHVLGLGLRCRRPAGDLLSRVLSGTAGIGSIGPAVVSVVASLGTSVSGLVALTVIDVRLLIVVLLGAPSCLLVARVLMRRTADITTRYQTAQGELSARLLDAVAGARTIRASGTADREITRVLEPLADIRAAGNEMWQAWRMAGWQLSLIAPALQTLVLATAGFGVVHGTLTPGEMIAAAGYLTLALGLLSQPAQLAQIAKARGAAARVAEVIADPLPVTAGQSLPDGPGRLQFRGVTMRMDDRFVLDHLDLDLPGGTTLALVGRSGTGKSTLAAVAGGLLDPDEGEVLLDGVPLRHADPDQLRAAVGYAFECPALLGENIADAIGYADRPAGSDDIERAVQRAEAHDFVTRLPAGYRTPLRELRLSGGELQRLGLARAICHSVRLIVLDDAMSSLDTATESRVAHAMDGALAGKTRLIVAHRAATAARADLVAWLDEGCIRVLAPHRDLWYSRPDYRALFHDDAADSAHAGTSWDNSRERAEDMACQIVP